MRFAVRRQREPQRLLGRGLADRAGDRDDLAVQALARGARQRPQAFERIVNDQQRRVGKPPALTFRHHGQTCAGFQRGVDEVVTVAIVALDRKECVALAQRAAVDGDTGNPGGQISGALGLHRVRHCVD